MFTNEGFARGRAEAMETRERIERRDRIERESAEAQRSRLERQSPDCSRRDFASILNGLTADRIAHERPGVSALHEIRKAQRLGQRSAASHNAEHARLEKMVGGNLGEALDRLHPGSALAKDDIATGEDAKSKYDPTGEIGDISPEFLLDVARMLLAMARRRAADAPKGRRDGGR